MTGAADVAVPLEIHNLSVRYLRRTEQSLRDVSLQVDPGEILLIAGASGSGKTTLMRAVNGLIPRTYRAEVFGSISVFGKPVHKLSMAQLSQQVGTLLQDPERQIVASHVISEVAFGMENLALPRQEILTRIDEILAYLGISHLRDRETFQLSGGEKQKVALAGVLAMRPRILLLDEPLASLDPASAQEALLQIRRLADDGISILLVEHRVEDALSIAPDRVLYLEEGAPMYYGDTQGLMQVVDYSRIKLPAEIVYERAQQDAPPHFNPIARSRSKTPLVKFEDVSFRYREDFPDVLKNITFDIYSGDIIAILGPNGAGKTTLVKHTLGLLKPTAGRVLLEGKDTRTHSVSEAAHTVGYVFQSPSQMLFAPTVKEELSFGPRNLGHSAIAIERDVEWALNTVHLAHEINTPPLALSFGQQKRISIASVLAMRSKILMMDEPTAGQDYWNYLSFMDAILEMPGFDAILFITHDVDLAVIYANRILLVDQGMLAADGPPQEVMADEARLRRSRVLPTSLLRLNLQHLHRTGRFMRAEALAHFDETATSRPQA
jgi:energy-coupling factor transport system ATP-binding protein